MPGAGNICAHTCALRRLRCCTSQQRKDQRQAHKALASKRPNSQEQDLIWDSASPPGSLSGPARSPACDRTGLPLASRSPPCALLLPGQVGSGGRARQCARISTQVATASQLRPAVSVSLASLLPLFSLTCLCATTVTLKNAAKDSPTTSLGSYK